MNYPATARTRWSGYRRVSRRCLSRRALDLRGGRTIITVVLREYVLTEQELLSTSRKPYHCEARWVAMRALSDHGLGAGKIGKLLHRDPSTVTYGLHISAAATDRGALIRSLANAVRQSLGAL